MEWTASSIIVPLLLDLSGVEDRATLLGRAGISEAEANDPSARISWRALGGLIKAVAEHSGDPAVGLSVGEGLRPGSTGLLDYLVRNSKTLGHAADKLCRFGRLLSDLPEVTCTRTGAEARFGLTFPPTVEASLLRPLSEAWIGGWLTISREITGLDWSPKEARFQYSAPEAIAAYRRVFRSPIHFDRPASEIIFDAELLDREIVAADQVLGRVLEVCADQLTAKLPESESIADRVHRALVGMLPGGDPALEEIAVRLAVSPRTLQRRLNEEATTFRTLVDQVRRDLALRYLQDKAIAIDEVATMLGFSTPSAFYRAFKRWTSNTPGDYRRDERVASA